MVLKETNFDLRRQDFMKFGVIVGSLRKESFSRKVVAGIVAGLPEDAEVTYIDIANLPLYSEDYDTANEPAEYAPFRQLVAEQDAIIFASPEHNRSMTAALKNALDIASRPWGHNSWAGKPALNMSLSIGGTGGMLANHDLRHALVYLDMPVMQQPELYINARMALDEDGNIAPGSVDFLAGAGAQFAEFAKRNIVK